MKKTKLLTVLFLILTIGCSKKEELTKAPEPINSFAMNINNQLWEPSLINNDVCHSTFSCELSLIDNKLFYTIKAFKDPLSQTYAESENSFRLQIMGVNTIGKYYINEPYGDFNSYARYIINEGETQKIYENITAESTSVVEIEEMLPKAGSELVGIKGTFSGTLYNINNPDDFIIISHCNFTFNKINRNNYCQCEE